MCQGKSTRRGRGSSCTCGCGGCECGCCSGGCGGGFQRKFSTRAERIDGLERYLEQLDAEATGVRERIADLKAGGGGGADSSCQG
jgi:hypothetical protein